MDILQAIRERNHGNRLAEFFDLVAGLMRGNPSEFKQGYPAAGAMALAARVIDLTADEAEQIKQAVSFIDVLPKPEPPQEVGAVIDAMVAEVELNRKRAILHAWGGRPDPERPFSPPTGEFDFDPWSASSEVVEAEFATGLYDDLPEWVDSEDYETLDSNEGEQNALLRLRKALAERAGS